MATLSAFACVLLAMVPGAWALGDVGGIPGLDVHVDLANPGPGLFPNVKTDPLQTSDNINVRWGVHFNEAQANLAGIRFTLHYDANEIDVLHVGGLPGGVIPLGAVTPYSGVNGGFSNPLAALPPSQFVVSPTNSTLNASLTFTGWVPTALGSGLNVPASAPFSFANFLLHARHTSLFNSDFDFRVSALTPIFHATPLVSGTFSVWQASLGWIASTFLVNSGSAFYLGQPITGVHGNLGLAHVPEPATALMLFGGLACLAVGRRKRLL
jgi:hypothetical protein